MKTTTEQVTPGQAAAWLLEKNTRNRHMNKAKVAKFVRDILGDKWALTHQSIAIAPSFIVDGQHRLKAIQESQQTVMANVTRYDSDEEAEAAFMAIDLTDKRTLGDQLEIAQAVPRGAGKSTASSVKALCFYGLAGNAVQPTNAESAMVLERERIHVEWALTALQNTQDSKKRFNAIMWAAFAAAHMLDPEIVKPLAAAISATEGEPGSVAQAWIKAEVEGKFKLRGGGTAQRQAMYNALRILQSAIDGTEPPKKLLPKPAVVAWFRERIIKRREKLAEQAKKIS